MSRALRLALLLLGVLGGGGAAAERFGFAVFGDIPYTGSERALMPAMLDAIAAEPLAFVVHVGDFKSGSTPCSDALYRDRRTLFDASPLPLILTPGDNDWTDCHRRSNGAHDPQERLDQLRRVFFTGNETLGRRRFGVERQGAQAAYAAYRENARWQHGRVLFLTLNVPGSHNNFGHGLAPAPEFVARSRANGAWLAASFARARQEDLKAVVILMQGNPDFEVAAANHPRPGYRSLLAELTAHSLAFPGQVLLVHGDSHIHRIDRPLRNPADGARIDNFTRLEVWGSPFMGWISVGVDDAAPLPFRFESRLFTPPASN